ncbi:hypothetical protein FD30_GL000893 [Levilactobacillus namurensis DSM 19117]|uniref:Uncharacterized protein n=1 Tax=Levilactobacillus namurensis DSM 19117 TaxID=1423773 RepID=A0A0R1JZ14_9LACO|nr:hypothetical protein [Levilactobacillus namurensis]PTM22165.1 hypothetical protein DA798_07635 [Lactobacillus sp. PFC-70]KRK73146.1 hypothetical protein FD30_GL000893 [Levilactobacillus namurensis DSM 19117]MCW3778713.1 hypothetical protein [Levilactobacillus namurensis]MDT7019654.1 hypothetical protein [Levilactobacillus namurensis]WNN65755.1 hypothetical protein RIN67_01290 [Levilactobacillus namurensis]
MFDILTSSVTSGLSTFFTFLVLFFFVYGLITFCYHQWAAHKKRMANRRLRAWAKPTGIQFWKE